MSLVPLSPPVIEDPEVTNLIRDLDGIRSGWWRDLLSCQAYIDGCQPLKFMSDAMRKEFGGEITELVLNFPELVTDAHNDRLDVEGFRFPGEPSGNELLWAIWQANNMDEQSVMGHADALALSKAAVIVGANPERGGPPLITVESAFDVSWKRDPRTGTVTSALKRWQEDDGSQWLSLYERHQTRTVALEQGVWRTTRTDAHGVGRCLLVPLVNRPRTKRRDGMSEFQSILGIADAATKIATDMMISAEYHAMPRRWAFGLKKSDFVDAKTGAQKPAWSFIKGRLWANESPDVKVGQFPESDLANFHNTIKLLARLVAQMTALPIDYLAFDSVNPPSADALRSAESRLVKRVERRQTSFGGTWEEVMRLALQVAAGSLPDHAMQLETVWRDPSTPTIAQKYDAVVKAVTTRGADGRPLVPTEQGRIDLGYTPAQRQDMLDMENAANANDPTLAAARELMSPSARDGG